MNTTSLLPEYYTNYYHMFWKITSILLVITTKLLRHYYLITTEQLLPHYYLITTSLLPHYYIRSTNYYQLLHNYYKRPPNYFLCKFDPHYYVITSITTYRPLLHDQLLHITTITTITNPHNLEMQEMQVPHRHRAPCQEMRVPQRHWAACQEMLPPQRHRPPCQEVLLLQGLVVAEVLQLPLQKIDERCKNQCRIGWGPILKVFIEQGHYSMVEANS